MDIKKLNELKEENDRSRLYCWIFVGVIFLSFFTLFIIILFSPIDLFSKAQGVNRYLTPFIGIIMFAGGVATVVSFIIHSKKSREYRLAYKLYFSEKTLEKVLDTYTYYPKKGIEKAFLQSLNCIHFGNVYRSEDLVIGTHDRVGIMQADLLIRYVSNDDDHHSETYFEGRWTIADYPKKFESSLIIVGNRLRSLIRPPRGYHKTEVESIEFNKRFDVYAKDGMEMFYILNPKVILKMQTMAEKYGNYIVFIFDNQKLHIGVSAPDSFEPQNTKAPLTEAEEIKRLSSESSLITDLIHELELEKKLFIE